MGGIRLHALSGDTLLRFDLREILAALGSKAISGYWAVSDVSAFDQELDVTGDGAERLEKLARSSERIGGRAFLDIASQVSQVIWGEFKLFDEWLSTTPRLSLRAVDSTYWECWSDDASLLDRCKRVKFARIEVL